MSKKGLKRAIANTRVVAMPSKVRENADGSKTQLYRIRPMRWRKNWQSLQRKSAEPLPPLARQAHLFVGKGMTTAQALHSRKPIANATPAPF